METSGKKTHARFKPEKKCNFRSNFFSQGKCLIINK